jgi:hypothetical protein
MRKSLIDIPRRRIAVFPDSAPPSFRYNVNSRASAHSLGRFLCILLAITDPLHGRFYNSELFLC